MAEEDDQPLAFRQRGERGAQLRVLLAAAVRCRRSRSLPAAQLFSPMPRKLLLPVVRESLEWHLARGVAGDDDAVLIACRALRYVLDGVCSAKGEAGAWALARVGTGSSSRRRSPRAREGRSSSASAWGAFFAPSSSSLAVRACRESPGAPAV